MSEVPVFMRGDNLPHRRPPSAISRSSSGKRHHIHRSSTLKEKSTLSMQRDKMKKKQNFKKRARQRPGIRESFFMDDSSRVVIEWISSIRL